MDANLRASVSFLLPNYRQSYLLMASQYLSVNVNLATVMSGRSIKVKFYCAAHHSGIIPKSLAASLRRAIEGNEPSDV